MIRTNDKTSPMRKLAVVALSGLATSSVGIALADPANLRCTAQKKTNCFADEIFILDGSEMAGDKPIVRDPFLIGGPPPTSPKNSAFDAMAAADRAIELIKAGGVALPARGWDQVVVFGTDIIAENASDQTGPLFYRVGGMNGVNEVNGIGLDLKPRDPMRPFVGVVHAGSSKQTSTGTAAFTPCGRPPARTGVTLDQPNPVLCSPAFHSYLDALAQATAGQFGPYLETLPDLFAMGTAAKMSSWPIRKSGLVDSAGNGKVLPPYTPEQVAKFIADKAPRIPMPVDFSGLRPRTWNALLDMGGSLLGGNSWRENGNGTWETTTATPYHGVSPPGTAPRILRFQDLDLYLLGFVPLEDSFAVRSLMRATQNLIHRPSEISVFGPDVGPGMGTRTGVALRDSSTQVPSLITKAQILQANGAREPAFDKSAHHIRQLWVLISKPKGLVDLQVADATRLIKAAADATEEQVRMKEEERAARADVEGYRLGRDQESEIQKIQRLRKEWGSYFYRATRWRGRVTTTFEGDVDDTAYWEFGSGSDDRDTFSDNGTLLAEFKGLQATQATELVKTNSEKETFARITKSPAREGNAPPGYVSYKGFPDASMGGKALSVNISPRQDAQLPINFVTVRLRAKGLDKAFALVSLDNRPCTLKDWEDEQTAQQRRDEALKMNPKAAPPPVPDRTCIRLPTTPKSFIIADGRWRNYAANLSDVASFTGLWRDEIKAQNDARTTLSAQRDKLIKDRDDALKAVPVPSDKVADLMNQIRAVDKNIEDLNEQLKTRWKPPVTSFTLVPSSEPVDEKNNAFVDIDFIRFSNTARPFDTDKGCDGKPQPDGFVDAEDNCPALFNPDQKDGDENGVGDDCEDFDGDNVPNKCDNCPTLTNSRQKDSDGDKTGDVCDTEKAEGCILQPDSLGGPLPGRSSSVPLFGIALGLGGVLYTLRRRHRDK